MALRDRFMLTIDRWQTAQGASGKSVDGPIFTEAARFSLLLDAMKMIGAGNGAGALGSVAALYYFAARRELHWLCVPKT